jgi:drug/metabolite transporter (DMT)-like permease
MNQRYLAHIALFLVALIYGANYSIAKEVLDNEYIQPTGFICMRVGVSLILFFIIHQIWIKERVKRKDLVLLFFCGLTGAALNQVFFFLGLKLTQPINASLIITVTPILVLIISAYYLSESLNLTRIIGIVLGLGGAVLLIQQGHTIELNRKGMIGDLLILINAISYGTYLVLVKKLLLRYHPFTVLKWVLFFGALIVFPLGFRDLLIVEWQSFPTHIWLAVIYVLIFTTFFTFLLNAFALKTVSPTVVSFYIYLQPIVASIVAILLAKDTLDLIKIVSAGLIFMGVYLVSTNSSVKTEKL